MVYIDWGFIIFTVLVAGAAGGALLCFRHMMHEGDGDHAKSKDQEGEETHAHN